MTINPNDLKAGLTEISNQVAEHCQDGNQNNGLENDTLACGQFYGDNVKERLQRGLHGTAAAILILLSSQKNEHVAIAKKLIVYAKNHKSIDSKNSDDDLNIIKQSEILASINNLAEEHDYCKQLKNTLLSQQSASNGSCGFYIDDKLPSELATGYLILALYEYVTPSQITKSAKYLWEKQRKLESDKKSSDIYAIGLRSFILYVLSICMKDGIEGVFTSKDLFSDIVNLWHYSSSHYNSQFEIFIEYYYNEKNSYIRLPWQIYLAHALLLSDSSYFYSKRFQRYLSVLNKSSLSGGYKYDFVGPYFSTRTNAILYSFLKFASECKPHVSLAFKIKDVFVELWINTWIRSTAIFILSLGVLLGSNYFKQPLNEQSPLWTEIIGAGITTCLAWLYGTGKK